MTDTPDLHTRSYPWHAGSAEPPRAGRFEELLAAEHEQFDHRSELLASVVEYRDAPSGTASAPRADPPDTPDLRTLAAEAIYAAVNEAAQRDPQPFVQDLFQYVVPAVLAAVLPAHRRQVLDQAAEVLAQDALCNEDTRYDSLAGAAVVVRRLASAAPETAPSPRQGDETAPAVGREAAQAQGPAEGAAPDRPRTWQLPDGWAIGEVEYGAAHDANCGHWDFGSASETRESMESWLADHEGWRLIARVRLVPLTDATPADGQALTDAERDNPKETP